MDLTAGFRRTLPILDWGRAYTRETLTSDLMAAVIVTIMLIPQSLAYALLAGLPPVMGLYASMLPLVAYALFGTGRTLAVGPVAVISLMTATAASAVAEPGTPAYGEAAVTLAALSGLMLAAMGLLRLGFLASLLSHPVIAAFISASGLLIATSQFKHLLGIKAGGESLPQMLTQLAQGLSDVNGMTVVIGVTTALFLAWSRSRLAPLLERTGLKRRSAGLLAKAAPALAVIATTLAVAALGLDARGVKTVGAIAAGLPALTLPAFDPALWRQLAVPALLISVVGFVESVSVAQTLAAKRRQRIGPDQELIGLGAANLAAAVSGGYPVTGGFARSAVNFDAGAQTPAAGAFTAVGIALAALVLMPLLAWLPVATLAATVIVAVLSLVDPAMPRWLWRFSRHDFAAYALTAAITLGIGVESGLIAGVAASLILHVWRASRPHVAIVGRVPGTQHFRNVDRHAVITVPHILSLRVDESLTYLNARWLEEFILGQLADQPKVRHVILMCSAINAIDASALEALEAINHRLGENGVRLHLSEVKGPVMDALKRTHLLDQLGGRFFLSQDQAFSELIHDTGEDEGIDRHSAEQDLARGLI